MGGFRRQLIAKRDSIAMLGKSVFVTFERHRI